MDDLRQEVLQILENKILLFNIQTTFDLSEFVSEAEFAIMNYCNIFEIPSQLKYVWANMALDLFRWTLAMNAENSADSGGGGSLEPSGDVSSIQSGDTTVSFSSSTSSGSETSPKYAHAVKSGVDGIILNYLDQLNKFRRIEW
jgi:hypothetical protein